MSLVRALRDALDERLGLRAAWLRLASEPVPGGARWAYVFGSVLAFLVIAQAVTGAALSLEYAPTTSSAHESLARLMDRTEVPWGFLVRGLHHHGASILVIALACHVVQVCLSGAYRRPREGNWITGLLLGAVSLALAFTGYLLPWDQTAYFATRVGIGILRSVPLVGPSLADVLAGGGALGNLTLTRFFTLHALILPAALAALLGAHLALFRRHGVTPASTKDGAESLPAEPFWPGQALRDLLAMALAFGLVVTLSFAAPPSLGAKADPGAAFDARPEWYFLWLFELLHHFEPPVEWVGTLAIPGALAAFLLLLPWIDRSKARAVSARRPLLLVLAAVAVALALLTANSVLRDAAAATRPEAAQPATAETALKAGPPISLKTAAIAYGEWCTECHAADGSPVDEDAPDFRSPDLERMAEADFEELVRAVKEGGEVMPAFEDELEDELIRAILTEIVVPFSGTGGSSE